MKKQFINIDKENASLKDANDSAKITINKLLNEITLITSLGEAK